MRVLVALVTQGLNPHQDGLPDLVAKGARGLGVVEAGAEASTVDRLAEPEIESLESATAFYAGFTGPDPAYGRRLARLESWGPGGADDFWRAASPWRQLNLPQIRLEPLLKARAEELSPGRIRFGHELIDLEQGDEGVRALIRETASGRDYVADCEYLLGADGGRRIPGLIGVDYAGRLGREDPADQDVRILGPLRDRDGAWTVPREHL